MKRVAHLGILLITGALWISCGSGVDGEKVKTGEAKNAAVVEGQVKEFTIDPANSTIEWKGSKPTGEHFGTVNLKNGKILVKDGNIASGKFTLDMTSIVNNDLADAEWNKKLVDHLNSADFFNTNQFPEATFELTEIKPYDGTVVEGDLQPTHNVTGNLTIKGIAKSITFPLTVMIEDNKLKASSTQFIIDRTEWDIQYQSRKFFDDLKDKFIYDEIGIKITVVSE